MKQFSRLAAMGMLAICALPAAARPQSIGQLATYNALAADDSAPRALRVNDQPIDRELLVQPHVGDFSARITLSQGKALLPLTAQQERGAYADPARVQISQNPDGSSTLRFPASDKSVVFNVVDFQAVGPATRVVFNAGASDDPGARAGSLALLKMMAGGFSALGLLMAAFFFEPGEHPLSRMTRSLSQTVSGPKKRLMRR